MDMTLPIQRPARRWLYVDFNSYFASVEQQEQPSLRAQPVIVVPVMSDATCAIAASYEAKAYGIRTGTPVWEARWLCPSLRVVQAEPQRYVAYHARICAEIERHIPVAQVCSIDEMACRLLANEMPRAEEIARAIKAGLAANIGAYVRCSIGIAPNRFLAKVATDLHKPDGLTFLPAEEVPARLGLLPIQELPGIGHNLRRRLNARGLHQVRDLLARSPRQMRALWGSVVGEMLWYELHGLDLPARPHPRRSVGHSHVLAPPLRPVLAARDVARRLTLKCASRLRRLGYAAGEIHLSLRIENGPRLSDGRRLRAATDSITFLQLVGQMWEGLLAAWPGVRIKKISLVLTALTPADGGQGFLLPPLPPGEEARRLRHDEVSRALDVLNHRYGRDTVMIGMPPASARGFSGTKIAFTRIPDREEFNE